MGSCSQESKHSQPQLLLKMHHLEISQVPHPFPCLTAYWTRGQNQQGAAIWHLSSVMLLPSKRFAKITIDLDVSADPDETNRPGVPSDPAAFTDQRLAYHIS